MEITTNTTAVHYDESAIKASHIEWIISDAVSIPFALIALYIFLAQIAYYTRKNFNVKSTRTARTETEMSSGAVTIRVHVNDRHAKSIIALFIFASISAFGRIFFDFRLVFGRGDDFGCNFAIKWKQTAYGISLATIYSVLWVRQRIFYEDPRLNHLSSKFTRVVSLAIYVVLISAITATLLLYIVGIEYSGSPIGCMYDTKTVISTARRFILIGVKTFFQVILLGLFLYPLAKHYRSMKVIKMSPERGLVMLRLVKRASITTAICIFVDIVSIVISFLLPNVSSYRLLLFDANLIVNLLCVIFSFPDWKPKLMPWGMKKEEIRHPSTAASDSRNVTDGK